MNPSRRARLLPPARSPHHRPMPPTFLWQRWQTALRRAVQRARTGQLVRASDPPFWFPEYGADPPDDDTNRCADHRDTSKDCDYQEEIHVVSPPCGVVPHLSGGPKPAPPADADVPVAAIADGVAPSSTKSANRAVSARIGSLLPVSARSRRASCRA